MDHRGNVEGGGQVHIRLDARADLPAEQFRAEGRSALGAKVLAQAQQVHGAACGFEGTADDLQADGVAPVDEPQTGRIVADEVHQHLLHGAEHAVSIDDVGVARPADSNAVAAEGTALFYRRGVVEIIGIGHRPGLDLLLRGVGQRPITEVPVASRFVLDPAAVNAPIVNLDRAYVEVQLGTDIGRRDAAEVHAQCLQQPVAVIVSQAEMFPQPRVDALVTVVVHRDAVAFTAGDGR